METELLLRRINTSHFQNLKKTKIIVQYNDVKSYIPSPCMTTGAHSNRKYRTNRYKSNSIMIK